MNKRKGISLIVLVITILVMIILAGVVVVSLQKNNPVEKAKEAQSSTNKAAIKEAVTNYFALHSADNSFEKILDMGTKYNSNGTAYTAGDAYYTLNKKVAKKELGVDVDILPANTTVYVNGKTGDCNFVTK